MGRISDKEIEQWVHGLIPSSGLRMGKSTLYRALLDLRDARARVERLEAALREIKAHANEAEHWGDMWYLDRAEEALEADDGE